MDDFAALEYSVADRFSMSSNVFTQSGEIYQECADARPQKYCFKVGGCSKALELMKRFNVVPR